MLLLLDAAGLNNRSQVVRVHHLLRRRIHPPRPPISRTDSVWVNGGAGRDAPFGGGAGEFLWRGTFHPGRGDLTRNHEKSHVIFLDLLPLCGALRMRTRGKVSVLGPVIICSSFHCSRGTMPHNGRSRQSQEPSHPHATEVVK